VPSGRSSVTASIHDARSSAIGSLASSSPGRMRGGPGRQGTAQRTRPSLQCRPVVPATIPRTADAGRFARDAAADHSSCSGAQRRPPMPWGAATSTGTRWVHRPRGRTSDVGTGSALSHCFAHPDGGRGDSCECMPGVTVHTRSGSACARPMCPAPSSSGGARSAHWSSLPPHRGGTGAQCPGTSNVRHLRAAVTQRRLWPLA